MKAKKSLEELYSIIRDKIETIRFNYREMNRQLEEMDARVTDNNVYLKQLDELIGHLQQLEPGK